MPTKTYPWDEIRTHNVDIDLIIGSRLEAVRRYTVDPRTFPGVFQDRLMEDGFDLTRPVTVQAALVTSSGGFAIRIEQTE
jgi:hypothetical protein